MRTSNGFAVKSFMSRALLAMFLATLVSTAGRAPVRAQSGAGPLPTTLGRSATLLPDGRWLLIGGQRTPGLVQLRGPDGSITTLNASPLAPRAWHTATLLADGSILVVGGVDARGAVLAAPERFDPGSATFERLPADGFAPRTNHTATLLSDGRVLLVGGQSAGLRDDADIWDPAAERAQPLGSRLSVARANHAATLEADGRVLIRGGRPANQPAPDEVFDPATALFQTVSAAPTDPETLYVTSVAPTDGATDVPLTLSIALRFSRKVDVRSISDTTVALRGPDGAVRTTVVSAEAGRLVFVRPDDRLQSSSRYELDLTNVATAQNLTTQARFFFTTRAEEKDDGVQDDDSWSPGDGNGWRINAAPSPWQNLPPLTAAPGVTALAGQVLRLNGRPLADVTLAIGGAEAQSDASGRFLLVLPGGVSGRRQLEIEGEAASRPGRRYGFFEAGLTIQAGQTNILPYAIWMPRLDTAHMVRIASPTAAETVVTTPFIPGLELHLPAGTVIKGEDGQVVREIGITPIPVDRPPFPLPKNVEVPIYFTIQPGGAYLYNVNSAAPKGGQLVYPNYTHLSSGVIANFWHYDPDVRDWYVYGWGTVRGAQVFPEVSTRLYEFTGAMINGTGTPPAKQAGNGPRPGDPVDISTGMLVAEQDDLSLPDVVPLVLRRTYRPADPAVRPFGIGTTHGYAMFLWSAHQYTEADLILPDGNRIHYVRTSSGTGYIDAVFEHTSSPTAFYKSVITWNGHGWDLRLRDGTVYVFGENAPLQEIRDRFGNATTIAHANGQSGNITSVTSPNGRWIAFSYDGSNRITQLSDSIGRTVGYQYDAGGRLWKVTNPAGGVTTYTYDTSNRLLTITDPRNTTYLSNQFDTADRVTLQTQADTTTFHFDYTVDGSGHVTQTDVTNPRGSVTRTTFNADGYATTTTEALGETVERTTTTTRASGTNRPTTIVDPLLRHTDYSYDANGNLASITRLAGTLDAVTTTFAHDAVFSQLTSVTDPLNHTTTLSYDAAGHLTAITDPLSHQTTFTSNDGGQPLTIANHETLTLTYDHGDLVSITDPLGRTVTRVTDAAGRLLRVRDAMGRTTVYAYDALDRVISVTNPRGDQTTFTYDGNGNVLTLTDAANHSTTWTYDDMDRIETRTDPLSRVDTYTYDAAGNLATVLDRKGQLTTHDYDPLERLTLTTYDDSTTTAYTYDAGNRTSQIADSAGGTLSRGYDDLDRLTGETTSEGTVEYTYDAAGRRLTLDVSGQSQITYAYDDSGRVTNITQGANTVVFAYDAANRRTSQTLPNGVATEYGYDAASQLTSLTYRLSGAVLGTLTYAYDDGGNPTEIGGSWARTVLPSALTSASYDAANQISVFGATSFTYDANGSLTSDGVNTYAWNARNQLVGTTGGSAATYVYDGVGRRRSNNSGGTTTVFLYDGWNPVQQRVGGTPTANFLTGLHVDEYFTRNTTGAVEQFLTDALGSSVALADGSGGVQTEYTYSPFGQTAVAGSSTSNTFAFTGREHDQTNLYFSRARYYSTALQRFLSEDPIGSNEGANLYVYVKNQPGSGTDPYGLQEILMGRLPYMSQWGQTARRHREGRRNDETEAYTRTRAEADSVAASGSGQPARSGMAESRGSSGLSVESGFACATTTRGQKRKTEPWQESSPVRTR